MDIFLLLGALILLFEGGRALIDPIATVAAPHNIEVGSPAALNFLRAGSGGITVTAGALMALALWVPKLKFTALVVVCCLMGGLVLGRAVSMIMDGWPGRRLVGALLVELTALSLACYFALCVTAEKFI